MVRPGDVSAVTIERDYPKLQKRLGFLNLVPGLLAIAILVVAGMGQSKQKAEQARIRQTNDNYLARLDTQLETDVAQLEAQRARVDAQAEYGIVNSGSWRLEGYVKGSGPVPLTRLKGLSGDVFTVITDENTECLGMTYQGFFYNVDKHGAFVCAAPRSQQELDDFVNKNS